MKKLVLTVSLALMAGMLPISKVQAQDVITTPATQVDPAALAAQQ